MHFTEELWIFLCTLNAVDWTETPTQVLCVDHMHVHVSHESLVHERQGSLCYAPLERSRDGITSTYTCS